jgi:hypothetical protein
MTHANLDLQHPVSTRRNAAEDVRDQIAALIDNGQLKVDERLPSELDLPCPCSSPAWQPA